MHKNGTSRGLNLELKRLIMHKERDFKKAFKNKGLLYLVDNHPNDTQYIGENVGSKDVLVKNTGIIV